ncbi:PIN domain-containing protein [Candidatus Bathyarchaeota archaeon]|nr:PIN domain-containing protein [Candidatus Bathyarchaeota archaeon]
MGSREPGLKVLLDTSFLLPSLGVEVGREVARGLGGLAEAEAEIYYSRFSVLESLWVVVRLLRNGAFDGDRFSLGLRSVTDGGRYRLLEEGAHAYSEGLRLYRLGHRDMIDNILYASSVSHGIRFLTLDKELEEFIEDMGLKDNLMFP